MRQDDDAELLGRPLDLPCGVRLKNRLIKSAMSDSLGDGAGQPTAAQRRLYERWADGGTALSLIGEVQTQPDYPEKPGNLVLTPDADMSSFRALAQRGSGNGTHIWPQLGQAGALAHAPISAPKGPSPLNVAGLTCAGMSREDIHALPSQYARAAATAKAAGFTGVQIHAGHGFLLSQFLSPLFNLRTDSYGGAIRNRFRIIGEVLEAVRHAVGPSFPIGIKINATDQLEGGLTPDDALTVIRLLNDTRVDVIEVSGGTYFPGAASSSDRKAASGPYFADVSRRAKQLTSTPVVLTGGFTTRDQAAQALRDGIADAVGLARALVLDPTLPNTWLGDGGGDPAFPVFDAPPPGAVTAWYTMRLTALGENSDISLSPVDALRDYEARDEARCATWRARFGAAKGSGQGLTPPDASPPSHRRPC